MAGHRENASRSSEGRASADALRVEEAQDVKDKTATGSEPPRAGRTGKVGTKAERPADSRLHKGSDGGTDPQRGGKAPSPAATDSDDACGKLPQPMRDATG